VVHSPEVWEPPQGATLSREHTLTGTSLTTTGTYFWFAAWLFVGALIPVVLYDCWIGG